MKNTCFLLFVLCSVFLYKLQAQEITMFNGGWNYKFYQDNHKVSKKRLDTLMKENSETSYYWKKAKTQNVLSWVSYGVFQVSSISALTKPGNANVNVEVVLILVSLLSYPIFSFTEYSNRKAAILLYNAQFDKPETIVLLKPKLDNNGFGLAIHF